MMRGDIEPNTRHYAHPGYQNNTCATFWERLKGIKLKLSWYIKRDLEQYLKTMYPDCQKTIPSVYQELLHASSLHVQEI